MSWLHHFPRNRYRRSRRPLHLSECEYAIEIEPAGPLELDSASCAVGCRRESDCTVIPPYLSLSLRYWLLSISSFRSGRTILCSSISRFSSPPSAPLHRDSTQSVLCLWYCLRVAIPPWEQVEPLRTHVPTRDERVACFLLGYSQRHHR